MNVIIEDMRVPGEVRKMVHPRADHIPRVGDYLGFGSEDLNITVRDVFFVYKPVDVGVVRLDHVLVRAR